jgi:hypothetical protein
MAMSWQAAWRTSIEERMDPVLGLPAVHAEYPARNLERVTKTTMPGGTAGDAFGYAIDIGCVEPDHPYVRDFLAWTIEMGETMRGDARRWETQWAVLRHEERSLLYGILALAYAMRDDAAPDRTLLTSSRTDAMEAYKEAKGWMWADSQSHYLSSVQFCLIEGDVAAAVQMLKCKRRFIWTRDWYEWLVGFVGNIVAAGGGPLTSSAAISAFDELFDRVRNPKFKKSKEKGQDMLISRSLLRIHLAILRHKYIDGGPVADCWREILQSISA